MAADGCHLAACSLDVLLVNIETFSSRCVIQVIAQPSLYKTGPAILSRTFYEKPFANLSLAVASIALTTRELPA